MQFLTIISAATLASLAIAAPQRGGVKSSDQACGNGQRVSCCNTGDQPQDLTGGLLGVAGSVLSPGTCQPISVPVIAGSIQDLCGDNVAQCCDSKQDGLLNLNAGNCLPWP